MRIETILNRIERHPGFVYQEEAESLARQAFDIRRRSPNSAGWQVGVTQSVLGESLRLQKRFAEAEPMLLGGYEILNAPGRWAFRRREALERIVALYEDWGKPDRAEAWRAMLAAGAVAARRP